MKFNSDASVLEGLLLRSVSDPYSFDTDPDPIRIQGFDDQKLKKFTAKNFLLLNYGTRYKLLIPRPPERRS
jgi:hypothetical protein